MIQLTELPFTQKHIGNNKWDDKKLDNWSKKVLQKFEDNKNVDFTQQEWDFILKQFNNLSLDAANNFFKNHYKYSDLLELKATINDLLAIKKQPVPAKTDSFLEKIELYKGALKRWEKSSTQPKLESKGTQEKEQIDFTAKKVVRQSDRTANVIIGPSEVVYSVIVHDTKREIKFTKTSVTQVINSPNYYSKNEVTDENGIKLVYNAFGSNKGEITIETSFESTKLKDIFDADIIERIKKGFEGLKHD
jgi:hypothetical protein